MHIPKKYGQSKMDSCPFCESRAIAKNKQGLNVCINHKEEVMPDIKCTCGSYLDFKEGKYGPYFNCINCGNINLKKGLEMKNINYKPQFKIQDQNKEKKQEKAKVNHLEKKDKFILDSGKFDNFDYGIE